MKILKKLSTLSIVLSMLAFSSAAYAQVLNVEVAGSVDVQTNTEAEVKTEGVLDVDTNAGVEAQTGVSGSVAPESRGDIDAKAEGKSALRLNASGIAVSASSQIDTDSDLEVFESNVSKKNKAVAKVDIESKDTGESEIKVVYKHKGRFLGIIPVTIRSTTVVETTADSETEIRSQMAWWGFLVSGKTYSHTDLRSRLENNATLRANAQMNASAKVKAQMAEAIIAELEATAKAEMTGEASVNG